ncbi:hypothetical protein L915_12286 [Phytophthora nicotianae]|uniref:Elicitin n=1 Tax=Phytophthora nicotianae TaxID=4792 RepID=W2GJ54_PHYNI|nr:hypothetical protein L915_12286 [Phytophthora nicotianae]
MMAPLWVILLLNAVSTSTTSATECSDAQFQTISSNANLAGCTNDVGFDILSALTEDQIKEICGSTACMALWEDVEAMGFGDCTIPDLGLSLQTDILDPVSTECSISSTGDDVGSDNASLTSQSSSDSAGAVAVPVFTLFVMMLG